MKGDFSQYCPTFSANMEHHPLRTNLGGMASGLNCVGAVERVGLKGQVEEVSADDSGQGGDALLQCGKRFKDRLEVGGWRIEVAIISD